MTSVINTQAVNHTQAPQTPAFDIRAIIEKLSDKAMSHIPMSCIRVVEGFNPRRYRDPESFKNLAESIKKTGVQQPIILRPSDDKDCFEVVAGHGRYEGNLAADNATIPAIIRLVNYQEALAIALTENLQRSDMSVIEESEAARRMLSLLEGDKAEAANTLGWDAKLLDRRLALLHCSEKVRDALMHKHIKLGHAELLAGLSEEMQSECLDGILAKGITVAQFKDAIGSYAYKLSDAIFCTQDCNTCSHNSSQTSDLFDSSLSGGKCMDRSCFDVKTKHALAGKAEELRETYSTVYLDTESDSQDRAFLVKSGDTGVGEEQFNACKACKDYGVLLNSAKGKEGTIEEGLCFNVSCNSKKIKSFHKAKDEEKKESISLIGDLAKDASTSTSISEKPAPKAKAEATPKRVIEFCNKAKLQMVTAAVAGSPDMVRVFTAKTLYEKLSGYGKPDSHTLIGRVLAKHTDVAHAFSSKGNGSQMIELLSKIDHMTLDLVISALAGSIAGEKSGISSDNNYVPTAVAALKATDTLVEKEWCVTKEFLETHTKSGLSVLAKDSGFDTWYDDANGEGAYNKIVAKKNSEIISGMMNSGFDWKGFVPETMKL